MRRAGHVGANVELHHQSRCGAVRIADKLGHGYDNHVITIGHIELSRFILFDQPVLRFRVVVHDRSNQRCHDWTDFNRREPCQRFDDIAISDVFASISGSFHDHFNPIHGRLGDHVWRQRHGPTGAWRA